MISSTESAVTNKAVGLAGVGTMGRCMLLYLKKAGYTVYTYDPFQAAREFACEHGAVPLGSPGELSSKTKLIILSLPAPAQVFEVIKGKAGLYENLTDQHVIVDTSTVAPETSQAAAEMIRAKGAAYVDAPILGRPSAAGNWFLPAGGSEAAISAAKPALETFAKQVKRVGGQGAGNAFKLLNQLMFSVINGVSSEVMALAEVLGVDQKIFYEVVANSGAATVSGLFVETAGRIVTDNYDDPTFTIELLCKDAGLGIEMAKAAGVTPLIAGFVQALNENAKGKGFGKKDTSSLNQVFKQFYAKANVES